MKESSDGGVVELFRIGGVEAYFEREVPEHRRGFWIDGDRQRGWINVGLGGCVFCVARLS